jgi:osmotically-inducible protein OsmY
VSTTLTSRDLQVRDELQHELEWDPALDAAEIEVSARDGVVTLTGLVGTYAEKLAAERAAKRLRGVRGVANDIDVRPKVGRTDVDIARDVVQALLLRATVPETVQAVVHDGHVTLTGHVRSLYQTREAEKAVRHVRGVRGVFMHVEVEPRTVARDVRRRIVEALHRDADLDARSVRVTIDHGVATLTGTVRSWLQREAAERAAAGATGIIRVINTIHVSPDDADEIC